MSSSTARVAAHRRREREGLMLIQLEIPEELITRLVDDGLVGILDQESPQAIAPVLLRLLTAAITLDLRDLR